MNQLFAEAATSDGGVFSVGAMFTMLLLFIVPQIIATWDLYQKAKQPGWKSVIPFYNTYTLIKIAGQPGWWFWLYAVPLVNIFVHYSVAVNLGQQFGKSKSFSIWWLWLFSVVGYIIIGLGKAKYKVPKRKKK